MGIGVVEAVLVFLIAGALVMEDSPVGTQAFWRTRPITGAAADDERFRRLLTATDKRVWESSHENAFWDWGYPKNASAELLEDLKAEGLV